jgi:hypothetical protein
VRSVAGRVYDDVAARWNKVLCERIWSPARRTRIWTDRDQREGRKNDACCERTWPHPIRPVSLSLVPADVQSHAAAGRFSLREQESVHGRVHAEVCVRANAIPQVAGWQALLMKNN